MHHQKGQLYLHSYLFCFYSLSLPKIPGYICKSRGKREKILWFSSITGSSSLTGGEAGIHIYKGSWQKWGEEGRVRQKNLKTPEGGHYSPESPETGRGGWHSQKFVCAGGGGGTFFQLSGWSLNPEIMVGGGKAPFLVYFILAFSRRWLRLRAVFVFCGFRLFCLWGKMKKKTQEIANAIF